MHKVKSIGDECKSNIHELFNLRKFKNMNENHAENHKSKLLTEMLLEHLSHCSFG